MRMGFAFMVVVGFLQACKPDSDTPCRDAHTEYLSFSSTQKAIWPYTSPDTLYWIRLNGDTLKVIPQQPEEFYEKLAWKNNPLCVPDSVAYPARRITFSDSAALYAFQTTIHTLDSMVSFSRNGKTVQFRFDRVDVDSATFTDTLVFRGKQYFPVFAFQESGDSFYYAPYYGLFRLTTPGDQFDLIP